ncbi:MAG: hypothetical protein K2N16_00235 [Muribaculaceae bacterium]|nr:hypothetical protein [Muribaculaceae bacterium]
MSKYSGKPFVVDKPAQAIADKFADLTALNQWVDMLPAEEREKLGGVTFTADSISFDTKQIGTMTFVVAERSAQAIKMQASGLPVALDLTIDLKALTEDKTEATCSIDIDLPAMLRPMVGPQLKKAVEMLSDVVAKIVG